jgi:hypothetical protein
MGMRGGGTGSKVGGAPCCYMSASGAHMITDSMSQLGSLNAAERGIGCLCFWMGSGRSDHGHSLCRQLQLWGAPSASGEFGRLRVAAGGRAVVQTAWIHRRRG